MVFGLLLSNQKHESCGAHNEYQWEAYSIGRSWNVQLQPTIGVAKYIQKLTPSVDVVIQGVIICIRHEMRIVRKHKNPQT